MAYPTTEELVAASTVDELIALTEEQQDGIRESSIAGIEDFCRQVFTATVETRNVRGTRKRKLYLPARLEAFVSASIGGSPISGVEVSADGDYLELSALAGTGYYEQALREVSGEPLRGFEGLIAITGTWGWTDPPAAVVTAIRLDMEDQARTDTHELSSTIATYRRLGVRDVTQGNLKLSLGDEVPLSPRVTRALRRYVWEPVGELI